MKIRTTYFFAVTAALLLAACEAKFDLSDLPAPDSGGKPNDTTYVVKGIWSGFNNPRAILYGQDQLFYIADMGNNQIILLNRAGNILSRSGFILHPMSLAQDSRLDLLIGAETIEPTTKDTIGIILRMKLVAANHHLDEAVIDTVWTEPARPHRRFVGIGVAPKDEFLVARDGPDNWSAINPDAAVMRFKHTKIDSTHYVDRFITTLSELQSGPGNYSQTGLNHPTGIATFPDKADFVVTQTRDSIAYCAIWMTYTLSADVDGWALKFNAVSNAGVDFIRSEMIQSASGVTVDKSRGDIFVINAMQDSVIKFNSRGKFKSESFGGRTPGISLRRPCGAAVAEKTLYIVDSGNNRIVLFRLSTDY
ncbi:MAG: hypothetical protein NTV54_00695 [Ignavibacteriales bacterium]|nr:hypothetical protein [Ignavibacteriales bacterium]